MKKLFIFFVLFTCLQVAQGQSAKKYLMFEHFTNTYCSICANQNPGFFDRIRSYEDDIHHISFHPPYPYDECELYQSNPVENESRASFYGVVGTPRVVWNGVEQTSASSVSNSGIEERIEETSDISIQIEETLGINRSVNISVKTVGEKPTGNLKFFAAIVEKEIQYNAPNGENVHHNVFRKMLTNINGENFTAAEAGSGISLDFAYSVDLDWDFSQIYVLAWVQDLNTSEILNSGTRFDVLTSTVPVLPENAVFEVVPNPSNGQFFLTLENLPLAHSTAVVYNSLGQVVTEINIQNQTRQQLIDLSDFETGMYLLKIRTAEGDFTKKIVKLN